MNDNCVPLEILESYRDKFNKREGQKYPCSNQIVICAIFTEDENKAINFMKDKSVVRKTKSYGKTIWHLDNGEQWIWRRTWTESMRGYRFYKLAIDKFIDVDAFCRIRYQSELYCCSMEII